MTDPGYYLVGLLVSFFLVAFVAPEKWIPRGIGFIVFGYCLGKIGGVL